MHQTGFAILDCFGSRVPKFSIYSGALYAQFIAEVETQEAILVPEESEVKSFEDRWLGPSGFLKQHMEMLETQADFTDEHSSCERNAIEYVMDLLVADVMEKLDVLRNVFEMVVGIRVKYGIAQPCKC
jgi:hypothetical protein